MRQIVTVTVVPYATFFEVNVCGIYKKQIVFRKFLDIAWRIGHRGDTNSHLFDSNNKIVISWTPNTPSRTGQNKICPVQNKLCPVRDSGFGVQGVTILLLGSNKLLFV